MDEPWKHAKWKKPDIETTYIWFLLHEVSRIGKSIEPENRLPLPRVEMFEGGGGEWLLMGIDFLLRWCNVLELDSGDGCTTLWIYEKPFNCIL